MIDGEKLIHDIEWLCDEAATILDRAENKICMVTIEDYSEYLDTNDYQELKQLYDALKSSLDERGGDENKSVLVCVKDGPKYGLSRREGL